MFGKISQPNGDASCSFGDSSSEAAIIKNYPIKLFIYLF